MERDPTTYPGAAGHGKDRTPKYPLRGEGNGVMTIIEIIVLSVLFSPVAALCFGVCAAVVGECLPFN